MDEEALEIEIDLAEVDCVPASQVANVGAADGRASAARADAGADVLVPVEEVAHDDPEVTLTPEAGDDTRRTPVALPQAFAEVVGRVEAGNLRELVANVFALQLRALDALLPVERALAASGELRVAPLFEEFGRRCASLLSHITEEVVAADSLDEEVRATLDGVRFVVAHEMGKVFRAGFARRRGEGVAACARADVARSWGLMHNCLQQTAISLAQLFDPAASGERLFEDYQHKVEDSVTLYRELELLLRKARRAEKSSGILLKHSLVTHLEVFRSETMHLLMYRDWAEFEAFTEEVKRTFEEMDGFDFTLHRFASYLETLLHHVGMREVLKERRAAGRAQGARPFAAGPDHTGLTVG